VDGTDALRLLAEHVYAAIVSDLAMPKLDGRGLYEEVERRWPSAHGRLVFVTGYAEAEEYDAFLRQSGVPVLAKPFTIADLIGAVQRAFLARPSGGPPVTRLAESSEQRYRALVESSRGLICTHDMAGVLLSVNRAAADRLGYAVDELVGRSLGDFLAPSVRAQFPQYLERLAHASGDEGLMLVATRDGEERIWSYSNVRCQEPGGSPYVLGHAHDITDIKRSDARARARRRRSARSPSSRSPPRTRSTTR